MSEKLLVLDLGDDVAIAVQVERSGPQLVSDKDIDAKFDEISGSIERVSKNLLDAVKRSGPSKATVELGFGLAVEEGRLVALFGKGKMEASIAVKLEWSADENKNAD